MALPMFPLGSVLFPYQVIPLHIFEDRYRMLIKDVLAGDGEFGVVLIERGSEVGGEEVRTSVGTVARVIEAEELDDGRWVLVAVGTRRVRVMQWLPDEPYPRAVVTDAEELIEEDVVDLAESARRQLTRLSAMMTELGRPAPPLDIEFSEELVARSHQMCAVAPLGALDAQGLLDIDGVGDRYRMLSEHLTNLTELIEAELAAG